MTYGELQDLVELYLDGDYVFHESDNIRLVALKSAYYYAADHCTALKLLTTNKDNAIMRIGPGSTYIRMPNMPRNINEELDIDSELAPAIARVIAHYVSKDIAMKEYHKNEALDLFRRYEAKVTEYLEEINSTDGEV